MVNGEECDSDSGRDVIPWAFVLVAEAPGSSGEMRLAAKAERKKKKIKDCVFFFNLSEIFLNLFEKKPKS